MNIPGMTPFFVENCSMSSENTLVFLWDRTLMHHLVLRMLKSPPKKCNPALGVFVGCMVVQAAHGADSES